MFIIGILGGFVLGVVVTILVFKKNPQLAVRANDIVDKEKGIFDKKDEPKQG